MLRYNSQGLRGAAPSICFVALPGTGVDESIRQCVVAKAIALASVDWRVHVLLRGRAEAGMASDVSGSVCFVSLDDMPYPATLTLDGPYLFPLLHESDRVYAAVRQLHEQHRFDLIEFPERGGVGFRAIQAKQTGQAFAEAALVVTRYGRSLADRERRQQWLHDPADLTLDYMERYCLEHANMQRAQLSAHDELAPAYPRLPRRECETQRSHANPLVTISVAYYNLGDFLEETLTALARQTYPNLEVLVINDGSTDAHSLAVFQAMRGRFAQFRFLDQPNAGIGATRNRGLAEARGQYFLPVDADNIARPDMVQRFVQGMEHNPNVDALTCFFLAFRESDDPSSGRFVYAYKPAGGPRVLGCLRNVYGDGNAIFRTEALWAVGGFETDRDTSFEDWEAFVKLVNEGHRVDVLPDFLFYYRHRDAGFSRSTNGYDNHQRVLRQFAAIESLPVDERRLLWHWLVGSQRRLDELTDTNQRLTSILRSPRHRLAASVKTALNKMLRTTKTLIGR